MHVEKFKRVFILYRVFLKFGHVGNITKMFFYPAGVYEFVERIRN